jgi:DNA-binding GntR family transcriptional regulator
VRSVYGVYEEATREPRSVDDSLLTLHERAYVGIRQMILDGVMRPNRLVREAHLARRLEMSRTPVREALRRLQAEGYLRAIPHGGYAVIEVRQEDLVNVYEVRAALEGLGARYAAERASRADIAQLEDFLEAMEVALEPRDDARLVRLNSEFHDSVAKAAKNRYLQSMLGNIRDVFERYRPQAVARPERRDAAHREHKQLLDAIRTRDGDRAEDLAKEHVHRALEIRLSLPVQLPTGERR